jgi:ATP-binding cassette subfamily B protein
MSFPLGYDAQVGEIGSHLSLGQRQRIAIARALIKDAPIVLLDEPTASLDSESEHKVKDALRRLCAGKTTLVIAHRLNTIEDADCIHVVEDGAIVESGSHAELLRKGGRYATFFRLQFRDQSEGLPRPLEQAVS